MSLLLLFHGQTSISKLIEAVVLEASGAFLEPVPCSSKTFYCDALYGTIAAGAVTADLEDFPVYVNLGSSSGISTVDTRRMMRVLGENYLKMQVWSYGQQCYCEVVEWNTEALTAELHIKLPHIWSLSDTSFYIQYDPSWDDNTTYIGVTGTAPAQSVWDSSYAAVYHMNDNPADSTQILDSTSNGNTGTKGAGAAAPTEVSGLVGKAQRYDGTDDYITLGNQGVHKPEALTVESFTRPQASTTSREATLMGNASTTGAQGWFLECRAGGTWEGTYWTGSWTSITNYYIAVGVLRGVPYTEPAYYGAAGLWKPKTLVENQDIYVAGTFDQPSIKLYFDGAQAATATYDYPIYYGTASTYIGANAWQRPSEEHCGDIYESRISNIARSASWIAATNKTLRDILVTYGIADMTSTADVYAPTYWWTGSVIAEVMTATCAAPTPVGLLTLLCPNLSAMAQAPAPGVALQLLPPEMTASAELQAALGQLWLQAVPATATGAYPAPVPALVLAPPQAEASAAFVADGLIPALILEAAVAAASAQGVAPSTLISSILEAVPMTASGAAIPPSVALSKLIEAAVIAATGQVPTPDFISRSFRNIVAAAVRDISAGGDWRTVVAASAREIVGNTNWRNIVAAGDEREIL